MTASKPALRSDAARGGVKNHAPRSITRPQSRWTCTVSQIDRVLAFRGTITAAAAYAGVSTRTAQAWREGILPAYYAEAKSEATQAVAQQRAARFLRPQDARAGR